MVNTPYDDVFRTLLTDCTALIIPVVNELFHTSYTGKETIHLLQNEHFIKLPDGSEQERITDSSFEILGRERKRYHVECQSTEDGSMIVRMFEYDTQLALENREVTAGALVVHFPDSAIVALRHTKNTPEVLAAKYEKVRKGVGESMGGKVLEYEAKDILNRGRAEGRDEGRREGRAEGEITGMKKAKMQLAVKLLQAGNSVAYVADLTELPEETVQKLSQAVECEDE